MPRSAYRLAVRCASPDDRCSLCGDAAPDVILRLLDHDASETTQPRRVCRGCVEVLRRALRRGACIC